MEIQFLMSRANRYSSRLLLLAGPSRCEVAWRKARLRREARRVRSARARGLAGSSAEFTVVTYAFVVIRSLRITPLHGLTDVAFD